MMGTLVGTGTRLFIGEKGRRKERTERGIEERKGRRPFRSASIFCTRYSPFLPTNEPGLSQYLNEQRCCERCLSGLVGNVTRPFTYLRFATCQDEFGPSEKPFFQCFFFRLVFSLVAVFISFTCLFPARQIAAVRKKIEKNLDFVEELTN